MLSINFLLINIALIVNLELAYFLFSFQNTQQTINENLIKIKYEILLPLFLNSEEENANHLHINSLPGQLQESQLKDNQSNQEILVNKIISSHKYVEIVRELLNESEDILKEQLITYNKINKILKFFAFLDLIHYKFRINIDKEVNFSKNLVLEMNQALDTYNKFLSIETRQFKKKFNLNLTKNYTRSKLKDHSI